MKRFLHIVLVLLLAVACRGPRVIPKDTMTDIYTDMFLADQMVRDADIPRAQMDTMLLYEAVFEKYGYDTEDYLEPDRQQTGRGLSPGGFAPLPVLEGIRLRRARPGGTGHFPVSRLVPPGGGP